MKELVVSLPDDTYERLVADAISAHKSPEQWVIEKLSADPKAEVRPPAAQLHTLLSAALDTLGFQRLESGKAERLSELLYARKERELSDSEATELHALMAEANALELASLQRLAATLAH
jgi:hypothetical protein